MLQDGQIMQRMCAGSSSVDNDNDIDIDITMTINCPASWLRNKPVAHHILQLVILLTIGAHLAANWIFCCHLQRAGEGWRGTPLLTVLAKMSKRHKSIASSNELYRIE